MKTDKEKIEDHLGNADEECESANFHDRYGMARDIFDRLKTLVPTKNHVELANRISEGIQWGM